VKIAQFFDIHVSFPALNAVLVDIDNLIGRICCPRDERSVFSAMATASEMSVHDQA